MRIGVADKLIFKDKVLMCLTSTGQSIPFQTYDEGQFVVRSTILKQILGKARRGNLECKVDLICGYLYTRLSVDSEQGELEAAKIGL